MNKNIHVYHLLASIVSINFLKDIEMYAMCNEWSSMKNCNYRCRYILVLQLYLLNKFYNKENRSMLKHYFLILH